MLLARVQWNDNIRALQTCRPNWRPSRRSLRQLFGQSKDEHIVITFGTDLNDAFANLDKLNATLAARTAAPGERWFNLGRLLPTAGANVRLPRLFPRASGV